MHRQPTNSCRSSTRSCAGWRPGSWPRRSPARRSTPLPWYTRRTSAWWEATKQPRAVPGTTAATSSPRRKEKLEEFKRLLEQFKAAAPGKWEALKDGLKKSFDELKELVGMDK